jgi:hypothetical protein
MFKKAISMLVCSAMIFGMVSLTNAATWVTGIEQAIKVEGEWADTSNVAPTSISDALFSGGTAGSIYTGTAAPAGGYYLGYNVSVEKAGVYELTFFSNKVGNKEGNPNQGGWNYTSLFTVVVNGNEIGVSPLIYYGTATTISTTPFVTYKFQVAMTKGTNNIKFKVADRRISGTEKMYCMYLDYFTLLYKSDRTIRVEAERINNEGTLTNLGVPTYPSGASLDAGASESKYIDISNTLCTTTNTNTDKALVKYNIMAPEAGQYRFITTMRSFGGMSNYRFKINGGEYYECNSTTLVNMGSFPGVVLTSRYKYEMPEYVTLNQGNNELQIEVDKYDATNYRLIVDCFDFIKVDSDFVFEAEYGYNTTSFGKVSTGSDLDYYSNLSFMKLDAATATTPNLTYGNVAIKKDATYDVYISMSSNSLNQYYVSPATLTIDSNYAFDITWANRANVTKVADMKKPNGTILDNTTYGVFKLAPVILTAGVHTLSVALGLRTKPTSSYYSVIDKIELIPRGDIASAGIELSKTVLSVGGTSQASTKCYTDIGEIIPATKYNATNYTVVYSSENAVIASVDATGLVTANKIGKTRIKAECTANGTTYTAYADISCMKSDGMKITGAVLNGSNVEVTVLGWDSDATAKTIVVAVYDENDLLTSVNSVITSNQRVSVPKKYTLPVTNVPANHTIKAFMWDGINTMGPSWTVENAQ